MPFNVTGKLSIVAILIVVIFAVGAVLIDKSSMSTLSSRSNPKDPKAALGGKNILSKTFGTIIKDEVVQLSFDYEIELSKLSTEEPVTFTSIGTSCGCSSLKVNGVAIKVGDPVPKTKQMVVTIESNVTNKEGDQLLQAVLNTSDHRQWVLRLSGTILPILAFDRDAITLNEQSSGSVMDGIFHLTATKRGSPPDSPLIQSTHDAKSVEISLTNSEIKNIEGDLFLRRSEYIIKVPATSNANGAILNASLAGASDTLLIFCRREPQITIEPPVAILRFGDNRNFAGSAIKVRGVKEIPFGLKIVESGDLVAKITPIGDRQHEYEIAVSVDPAKEHPEAAGALLIESTLDGHKEIRIPYAISATKNHDRKEGVFP